MADGAAAGTGQVVVMWFSLKRLVVVVSLVAIGCALILQAKHHHGLGRLLFPAAFTFLLSGALILATGRSAYGYWSGVFAIVFVSVLVFFLA